MEKMLLLFYQVRSNSLLSLCMLRFNASTQVQLRRLTWDLDDKSLFLCWIHY